MSIFIAKPIKWNIFPILCFLFGYFISRFCFFFLFQLLATVKIFDCGIAFVATNCVRKYHFAACVCGAEEKRINISSSSSSSSVVINLQRAASLHAIIIICLTRDIKGAG
ncbi:unnamed protein product [Ceratitis capitata]|uniref:(Mediterranean fruit fly) hypothetical protein n=1 Tax=Ceratitis capitata TaxID=7213 RepID=A0A811VAS3_CERCA|nr:unnamed protein product [Ceratitis capitata]